jgi:hypothetical protein
MMVFKEWYNGCPMAYVITSRSKQIDLLQWMHAINWKMLEGKSRWWPNVFIVDDADAKINNIK